MKMYAELYENWKKELESSELSCLFPDFYVRVADYLRKIREESRMLDKKTVKASLLRKENRNVKRMVHEIVEARYKKLVRKISTGEKIPLDALATEEKKLYAEVAKFVDLYQNFVKNLLQGHFLIRRVERAHQHFILRFLNEVPPIIGLNLKTYGPFKTEDVASVPVKNAKTLTAKGLAKKVEVDF